MSEENPFLVPFSSTESGFMDVLEFWFGSASAINTSGCGVSNAAPRNTGSNRRKKLWFVSDGDAVQRERVDTYITKRFGGLVARAERGELDDWGQDSYNPLSMLALVLVLDQFSRHIYRHHAQKKSRVESNTAKAAEITRAALKLGLDHSLEATRLCFLLMPLRHVHAEDASVLEQVLRLVEEKERRDGDSAVVLERFKSATQHRLEKAQRLRSNDCSTFADSDILEPPPKGVTQSPEEEMEEEPLYHSMVRFLLDRYPCLQQARQDPKKAKTPLHLDLFVSLSGGVDSMVIAKILSHIAKTRSVLHLNLFQQHSRKRKRSSMKKVETINEQSAKQARFAALSRERQRKERLEKYSSVPLSIVIKALHVDYGNRVESHAEAAFVQRWCKEQDIQFVERRIEELRRGAGNREEYEKLTREMRFELYRSELCKSEGRGIFFGHHQGDVEENVISNVMRGCSVFEISGMTAVSRVSGVKIWRPLLTHIKEEIFDFAHRFGVPYFKDTTPKWSTRGKLRNQLLPLLHSIYGKGFGKNLNSIAKQSDSLHEELNSSLFGPFLDAVVYGKVGIVVDCQKYLKQPLYFWKHVLREICHKAGISAVHDKPVKGLLQTFERMHASASHTIWLELKAENRCFMYKGRHLVILRSSFIPSGNTPPSFDNLDLSPGLHERSIGCWKVLVTPKGRSANKQDEALYKTGKMDILRFCVDGTLEYTVQGGQACGYRLWNNKETHEAMQTFAKVPKKFSRAIPFLLPKEENDGLGTSTITLTFDSSR